MTTTTTDRDASDHPAGWRRYLYSTNHKDIGTLYICFAIIAGIIGVTMSIAIRAELMSPGIQVFPLISKLLAGDNSVDAAKNMYNVFITAPGGRSVFTLTNERPASLIPAPTDYGMLASDPDNANGMAIAVEGEPKTSFAGSAAA